MSEKPILYVTFCSPPCCAVLLVAEALGIELDVRDVSIEGAEHLKPEFLKLNPQHTLPTLDDSGNGIWDSHAISTYLIGKFGKENDPLYPKDLLLRAHIDQRLQFESNVYMIGLKEIYIPLSIGGACEISATAIDSMQQVYDFLEAFLSDNLYMAGNHLTVADFSLISSIGTLNEVTPLNVKKHVKVAQWINRMYEVPYIRARVVEIATEFKELTNHFIARNKAASAEANK